LNQGVQRQRTPSSNQLPQPQGQAVRSTGGPSPRILQEQTPPPPRSVSNSSAKTSAGSNWHNQNHNPANTAANTAANTGNAASKRPGTPSIGGFHFPPGMNPLGAQARADASKSLQRSCGTGQPPSSGVGQKRTVDAMQGSTRRPVQGMGLAHQSGGGKREPLARLDLGESGDVKRMKL